MDIGAILKILEVGLEDEDEYATGSRNSILGIEPSSIRFESITFKTIFVSYTVD
jgi:hypothetical protein